jgi:hypothetical protein
VKTLEQSLRPTGHLIVVAVYTGIEGVGWSEPGCETLDDAVKRVGPHGPDDLVAVIQTWGCPPRVMPHSHDSDEVKRWPMAKGSA